MRGQVRVQRRRVVTETGLPQGVTCAGERPEAAGCDAVEPSSRNPTSRPRRPPPPAPSPGCPGSRVRTGRRWSAPRRRGLGRAVAVGVRVRRSSRRGRRCPGRAGGAVRVSSRPGCRAGDGVDLLELVEGPRRGCGCSPPGPRRVQPTRRLGDRTGRRMLRPPPNPERRADRHPVCASHADQLFATQQPAQAKGSGKRGRSPPPAPWLRPAPARPPSPPRELRAATGRRGRSRAPGVGRPATPPRLRRRPHPR